MFILLPDKKEEYKILNIIVSGNYGVFFLSFNNINITKTWISYEFNQHNYVILIWFDIEKLSIALVNKINS